MGITKHVWQPLASQQEGNFSLHLYFLRLLYALGDSGFPLSKILPRMVIEAKGNN
jgi:hypothetical protein